MRLLEENSRPHKIHRVDLRIHNVPQFASTQPSAVALNHHELNHALTHHPTRPNTIGFKQRCVITISKLSSLQCAPSGQNQHDLPIDNASFDGPKCTNNLKHDEANIRMQPTKTRAWKIAETASDGNLVESQGFFLGVRSITNLGFPHLMGFNSKG